MTDVQKTEELTDAPEVKPHNPEGSLTVVPVLELNNNPNRPDEIFKWNEEKILGLMETYLVDGFQSTFEVTDDKWGAFYLAGGGHHRTEALRRMVNEGNGAKVRGLFLKNDKWCIKAVKKKYTAEQMMRNFMIENADAWGKDNQQNVCMMVKQIKDYLDKILVGSADVEKFIESVKSPYPLKMDKRAFTRLKNAGEVGASVIVQYLGPNTWSRQAIDAAIKVLYEDGPEGEKLRELAQKLPNVTTALSLKKLMVTENEEGEKMLAAAEDQEKAFKLVEKNALSRADIEAADKIKKEQDMTPLAALDAVLEQKKAEVKKDAPKAAERPSQKKTQPAEDAMEAMKRCLNTLNILKGDESDWSKAQVKEAKSLFKDIATAMKELVG